MVGKHAFLARLPAHALGPFFSERFVVKLLIHSDLELSAWKNVHVLIRLSLWQSFPG